MIHLILLFKNLITCLLQFDLPKGIEELCFPDAAHWLPQPQEIANIYTLVLTDCHGNRTFGYCRRIVAEGDTMCLPLALCILTRHNRSRGLFSQVRIYRMKTMNFQPYYYWNTLMSFAFLK